MQFWTLMRVLLCCSIAAVYLRSLNCLSTSELLAFGVVDDHSAFPFLRTADASHFPTLEALSTPQSEIHCTAGLQRLTSKHENQRPPIRKIPRIIHQTSKSACVTKRVANTAQKWRNSTGFSYMFHDDKAVHRLFHQDFPEFPHLRLVVERCIVHGTLAADLWRYLILWQYGGIYADLDAVPATFDPEISITSDDDAFFVVEQYHLLSQWFMAVAPRHPIMFYAVHHSLTNLLKAVDTGTIPGKYKITKKTHN